VLLDHTARYRELDADLHTLQGHAQRLGAHELLPLRQDDVQVALQDLTHVGLLEIVAKGEALCLLRVLSVLLAWRPVSIFNQKRGISNNWSASFFIAYFENSL
jgi:hypothetical protein